MHREEVSEDEDGVDEVHNKSLLMALRKMIIFILIGAALARQFITGSPLWGYKGKWTNIHTYLAPFTVSQFIRPQTTLCITDLLITWILE